MAFFVSRRSLFGSLGACLSLLLVSAGATQEAENKPEQIYKQSLPSVMTLKVELKAGGAASGTAFLALKEGMAVTCWHVIEGAKRVTARFSDGEEFEVTGLIDRDEKRDLALIRVKVAGRPLLSVATADPPIGTRAYAIGAPRGLEFSISDGLVSQVRTEKGRKEVQISCPVSPGNSGGPVIGADGKVIGVVSYGRTDGQNLNFAISSSYAAAFDTSLSTQTWDKVESTPGLPRDGSLPAEASRLDTLMAESFLIALDAYTAYKYTAQYVVIKSNGYRNGVPNFLYSTRREALDSAEKLAEVHSTDPAREKLRMGILSALTATGEGLDLEAKGILLAQQNAGWGPLAKDLFTRATAAMQGAKWPRKSDIEDLMDRSEVFSKTIQAGSHSVVGDDTNVFLDVLPWQRRSLVTVVVEKDGLGDKIGLEPLDLLVSLDGQRLENMREFKRLLKEKAGSKVSIVVERNRKQVTLNPKLPKEFTTSKKP